MLAGSQKAIIKLPNCGGAQACRISITRLAALGPNVAGTYDPATGLYLHLTAALGELSSDMVTPNDPDAVATVTEWDPEGVEVFPPGCAQVELLGGLGRWSVKAVMVPIIKEGYAPRIRRLKRFLDRTATFVVPAGHDKIGCLSGTATLNNVSDGTPLVLVGGVASPIPSGTIIGNTVSGTPPLNVWTEFKA